MLVYSPTSSVREQVFTLQNMHQLVEHTRLAEFRSR